MDFEREKCVDLCELGIEKKRNGQYNEAIALYQKAISFDPTFSPAYMNTAKVQIGIKEYDYAFKNLMTYAHLNWLNPTYNTSQYQMLLPAYEFNQNITEDLRLQDNLVSNICEQYPSLKIIAVNINLTLNAGVCYTMSHPQVIIYNSIDVNLIYNHGIVLLGQMPQGKVILGSEHEIMINLLGFAYIIKNLKNINVLSEVINIYLSDSFSPLDL